jgi:hypothetical protein
MYAISIPQSDRFRLLRRIDKRLDRSGGPDACHPWRGRLHNGYGNIEVNGRTHAVSRVVYALMVGDVPAELDVLHSCDNRACGNHRHLFLGTQRDNMQDMIGKGRGNWPVGRRNAAQLYPERLARGERQGNAKLTADQVREIRALAEAGMMRKDIAVRFGVSHMAISKIVLRQSWAHI